MDVRYLSMGSVIAAGYGDYQVSLEVTEERFVAKNKLQTSNNTCQLFRLQDIANIFCWSGSADGLIPSIRHSPVSDRFSLALHPYVIRLSCITCMCIF